MTVSLPPVGYTVRLSGLLVLDRFEYTLEAAEAVVVGSESVRLVSPAPALAEALAEWDGVIYLGPDEWHELRLV